MTERAWPLETGNMPIVAWWPNLIVIFEMTMLGAILATVLTLLVTAKLPSRVPPLYDPEVTDGKILVGVVDPSPAKSSGSRTRAARRRSGRAQARLTQRTAGGCNLRASARCRKRTNRPHGRGPHFHDIHGVHLAPYRRKRAVHRVRQAFTRLDGIERRHRDVRLERDLAPQMDLQRAFIQSVVKGDHFFASFVQDEEHVTARANRIPKRDRAPDHESDRPEAAEHVRHVLGEHGRRQRRWKDAGEVRVDPRGLRVVACADGLDPSPIALGQRRIRHNRRAWQGARLRADQMGAILVF